MRLICKASFKDYYDSCMSYGIDPLVVYVRTHEEFIVNGRYRGKDDHAHHETFAKARAAIAEDDLRTSRYTSDSRGDALLAFVGFCGKIYPALRIDETPSIDYRDPLYYSRREKKYAFIYTLEQLEAYSAAHPDNTGVVGLLKRKNIEAFFKVKDRIEPFLMADAPIFAYCDGVFHINPKLVDYGFAKMIEGARAFQEISAFISGTLMTKNQMPPIPITDKQRAETKGFDDRSFRKAKSK